MWNDWFWFAYRVSVPQNLDFLYAKTWLSSFPPLFSRLCCLTAPRQVTGGPGFTLWPCDAHPTYRTLSGTTRLKHCSPFTAKKVWISCCALVNVHAVPTGKSLGKKVFSVFLFNIFWCACLVYCAVLERPLQELREELQTDVTEALAAYRKHCCSASVSTGQVRF